MLKSCNQDQAPTMEVGNHRKREREWEKASERNCMNDPHVLNILSSVLYIWEAERRETKTKNN